MQRTSRVSMYQESTPPYPRAFAEILTRSTVMVQCLRSGGYILTQGNFRIGIIPTLRNLRIRARWEGAARVRDKKLSCFGSVRVQPPKRRGHALCGSITAYCSVCREVLTLWHKCNVHAVRLMRTDKRVGREAISFCAVQYNEKRKYVEHENDVSKKKKKKWARPPLLIRREPSAKN